MFTASNHNLQHPLSNPSWTTKSFSKLKEWIRRYLFADLAATVTGLLGVYLATRAGADLIVVAYVGSIAEGIGYYTPLLLKDWREQRSIAPDGALMRTVRNLMVEFGLAELLDSGVIRPVIIGLCIAWIPNLGVATYVGMTLADVFFYGFAIAGYELRKRILPDQAVTENGNQHPTQESDHASDKGSNYASDQGISQNNAQLQAPRTYTTEKLCQSAIGRESIARDQASTASHLHGYLVRRCDQVSVPRMIPLYRLTAVNNEVRQMGIGRHSQRNAIVLNTGYVSRQHARFLQQDGRLYLQDNRSLCGTYLNSQRLSAHDARPLNHGDLIHFADVAYEYQVCGD